MRKMMMAVCVAAAFLMLTGCGNGEQTKAEGSGAIEQVNRNTEEQDDIDTAGSAAAQNDTETGDMEAERDGADTVQEGQTAAEQEPVQLAGRTISFFGDSITTFRGYNPEGYAVFFPEYGAVTAVEDTWWQRVVDDLKLTLYKNGSSSGAAVAGDSTGTEDPLCACNELRTAALAGPQGACPEIIIVYLGTNDLLNTVPLGTNDGTTLVEEGDVKAFSDAYTLMIDKLQSKYPPTEIYCCTLLPVGDYGVETSYVEFVNGDGLTAADYSRVIVQIAENKGLSVIDLQDCGITIENLVEMTTDGVHPTAAGMACIAEAVKGVLK